MIYILDTDVFTLAERADSPEYLRLHAHALQLSDADKLVTTIVTYEEQTRGWLAYAAKSRATPHQVKAYGRLKKHLQVYLSFEALDFDTAAAAEFDRLCSMKLRIAASDLKIAAIALAQDATLISRNTKDFQRVFDLRLEDWTQ
ncbi:MAG TPA: type II toxin-antitoxin system VapC family toxin [Tepidisphaeraceae bacterium]|nr:type II toxin-antitoxin system VapC family toxin [Tepidisphaeraceae bacterium]